MFRGSFGLRAGVAFLGIATTSFGAAAGEPLNKAQYSLFNPVPASQLRELSTDRPDSTESPFTVDAGHFQIETSLIGYARSRADADGTVTSSYEFGTTNIRLGLTHNTEINFVWQPYGTVRMRSINPSLVTRQSGVGAIDIRAKINFWGNDRFERPGATALGLLPYVTLPTDRYNGISVDDVEGGVIVPFAIKLNDKFGLGLNTGVAAIRNPAGAGYIAEWLASASLSYEWSDRLGTYYEIAGRFARNDQTGEALVFGTGATYKVNANLQLDAGINFGLTRAADRINPFAGITVRY